MGGSCILVKLEETLVFSFFVLHCDRNYVLHCLYISCGNTALTLEKSASLGIYVLDHLDADGAGFAGGQVTVVAVVRLTPTSWAACILKRSIASRAWGIFSWLLLIQVLSFAFFGRKHFPKKAFSVP